MQKIELKKIKANEIFSPLIKKFDRLEKVPHYKDEIWSNDLIDSSSLSEYNTNSNLFLPFLITMQNMLALILLKTTNQEKVQQKHLRN